MVNYNCLRCGYETSFKNDLRKHYKRKKICKAMVKNISIDECLKEIEPKKPNCEYCGKIYSRKSSLNRHQKQCKDYQICLLKEKVRELETCTGETHKIQNIGQQQIGDNNTINNFNININAYSDTDIDKLRDKIEKIKKLKNEDNIDVVIKYIRNAHFNKDLKENHNIYAENSNIKRIMKYDGEKFVEGGRGNIGIENFMKKDIERELTLNSITDGEIWYEYEEVMTKFDHESEKNQTDNNYKKEVLDRIFSLLHGNREMVKETHRQINDLKIK